MNRVVLWLVLFSVLCSILAGCDALKGLISIPSEFSIETTSELGPATLGRIDEVNKMLERGIEIGPETRASIDEINQTIQDGIEFGFNSETLQRVDGLLREIEDGLQIGIQEETLERIDDLIDLIDDAPGKWEASATEIIYELERSAGTAAGKMADEIEDLIQEARVNSQKLIATGGIEFRCNVDFLGVKVGDTIDEFVGRSLIGRLRAIITGEEATPPTRIPWVCQIIPDRVDLTTVGAKLVFEEGVITITGFNFVSSNLPEAYVVDERDQRVNFVQLFPARQSDYQILLNLQAIDFSVVPVRSKIVFQWPNVPDTAYATAILLPLSKPELEIKVQTSVYRGPSTSYRQIGVAEPGAAYVVTGKNGDATWWQIDYADGQVGWVPGERVERNDIPVDVARNIPLPPPSADFIGDPLEGESPLEVRFTDTSTANPTSWEWHFGDGGQSTKPNPTHTYYTPGEYDVTLTATNAQGSDDEAKSAYITVNPSKPTADFIGDPLEGESPLEVRFTDTSTANPTSWEWHFGDGGQSTKPNPTHTYYTPGEYDVTLTATNAQGSDDEAKSAYITVNPPKPTADFTGVLEGVPPGGRLEGVPPVTVRFKDTSTGNPTVWEWHFGDGGLSDDQHPTHTYNEAGAYSVRLKVSSTGGDDEIEKQDYVFVLAPLRWTHSLTLDYLPDGRTDEFDESRELERWTAPIDHNHVITGIGGRVYSDDLKALAYQIASIREDGTIGTRKVEVAGSVSNPYDIVDGEEAWVEVPQQEVIIGLAMSASSDTLGTLHVYARRLDPLTGRLVGEINTYRCCGGHKYDTLEVSGYPIIDPSQESWEYNVDTDVLTFVGVRVAYGEVKLLRLSYGRLCRQCADQD